MNRNFTPTEQFATVAHELGHLYCGHLGTPNPKWWPDRAHMKETVSEFEAESVAYIACKRVDDAVRMPPHLVQYLAHNQGVPDGISLKWIMTAAGRVIDISSGYQPPRKPEQ